MKPELYRAINNRDGEAMASMAGGNPEHGRVVNSDAERLVDALFMQLKQIFPAATQTNLRSDADERVAKQQWIAAFSENGIRTRDQLSAGVRHARASESPFWPSPGQFIKWCKDIGAVAQADITLPVKILSIENGNSKTVSYDSTTGFLTWKNDDACALVLL